jgi:predicted transposase YbfD/YdcC
MEKINNFILEVREKMGIGDLPEGGVTPYKSTIYRFLLIIREIDDVRKQGMIEYPLEEIILIAFLAILGNASTWTEIALFGKTKERWLKKFLKLKNGIPSHDTFRRVFSLISPDQLQEATIIFLERNFAVIKKALDIKEDGYRHICVDGKEQRGTGRKYGTDEKIKNLQTLHVYDASNEICLFSKAIGEKTNEIPVARDILDLMNLKRCIVTFDALHTQKDTINIIAGKGGDYVGGLKGNQGNLEEEARDTFTPDILEALHGSDAYHKTVEKAHNQIETREYYIFQVYPRHTCAKGWKKLKNFVRYEKHTVNLVTGKESAEIRHYVTSLSDVALCADAIRGHWAVENKLHFHLDYSLCEDDNTTMDKNAFNNYSLLNKMVLSLCKLARPLLGDNSIRSTRKQIGWEYEQMLSTLLRAFDGKTLKAALENTKK